MSRRVRRLGPFLLAACCLLTVAVFFRAPILRGMAQAWIVNEPPTKVDAIVILGGGLDNRPLAAAKLYHDGFAPKILYMDVKLDAAQELGIYRSEKELTRRLLLSNNIPETAMEEVGHSVANTYDESVAVRAWIEKNNAKSILIATDPFHTRRVRWLFRKQLSPLHIQVLVKAARTRQYFETNWWQNEQGAIAFQNEIFKYAYYRFRY